MKKENEEIRTRRKDEPLVIPLDFEEALERLLQVEPGKEKDKTQKEKSKPKK